MDLDLTGRWIFYGHPWDAPHPGRIAIELTQSGTTLRGTLRQMISPASGRSPGEGDTWEADVVGEIIDHPVSPLVILKRINRQETFRAVFAGGWNAAEGTISGTFRNTSPGGGTFIMERDAG
jgi:hypothetical protein